MIQRQILSPQELRTTENHHPPHSTNLYIQLYVYIHSYIVVFLSSMILHKSFFYLMMSESDDQQEKQEIPILPTFKNENNKNKIKVVHHQEIPKCFSLKKIY